MIKEFITLWLVRVVIIFLNQKKNFILNIQIIKILKQSFTVNGTIINKLATLEENGIKNGNAIVLNIIDE